MVVEGEGGQKKRVGKIIEERTRAINKRGGEKTTRRERGKEQERGKEKNRKRKGRKRKEGKRKGEEGNDSAPGGAAPRRGQRSERAKSPNSPLKGWGTSRDQASWEKARAFSKKSFFCASGLKGLYERLVSQISIPQC